MSIFNWFSRHSSQEKSALTEQHHSSLRSKKSAALSQEDELDQRSDRTKLRHLRRDQSFVAIREAMTRTGILSANYKFKVFSEDQLGNEFVVMISLVTVAGDPLPPFSEMEAGIMESTKARFDIVISAVYWRLMEVPITAKSPPLSTPARVPSQPPKSKSPYETIEADEVLAFQQALLAASAQGHSVSGEKANYRKQRSQLSDFEDTEMTESKASLVLSKTQYGELN